VLQRNRVNRVMVLTTHFMDEADLLGDRIVILSQGNLKCAGSSLFLKQLYGTGYNLTCVKREQCNVTRLEKYVKHYVKETKVLTNVGSEIVLQLPSHASSVFPDLLASLDQNMTGLGIAEYGISVTTLEEVFLRIASHDQPRRVESQIEIRKWREHSLHSHSRPSITGAKSERIRKDPSVGTQYSALLQKRYDRRDQLT
jgi:ATP-binding cassette subfamily A (ABC1) protein 3